MSASPKLLYRVENPRKGDTFSRADGAKVAVLSVTKNRVYWHSRWPNRLGKRGHTALDLWQAQARATLNRSDVIFTEGRK